MFAVLRWWSWPLHGLIDRLPRWECKGKGKVKSIIRKRIKRRKWRKRRSWVQRRCRHTVRCLSITETSRAKKVLLTMRHQGTSFCPACKCRPPKPSVTLVASSDLRLASKTTGGHMTANTACLCWCLFALASWLRHQATSNQHKIGCSFF